MRRLAVGLVWLIVLGSAHRLVAQFPNDSPRRTRQVEIIERYGSSVVAIFTEDKDNTWGSGSGSVIHRDGYILTNDHVVEDHPGVVLYSDHPPLPFRTIGRVKEKDLALIKVDAPKPLVTVPLGRSHDMLAGEPILIGGNPGGRGTIFSAGIVSSPKVIMGVPALAMTHYPDDTRDRFIQFDANSNPGNSGGPLINAEGRQVGVVAAGIFQEQAVNFAIPIDLVHRSLPNLILPEERGDFWTGIELELAATTVRRIAPKSPAEQAGLRAGDTVMELNGSPVASAVEYLVSLLGRKRGERIAVRYTRAAKPAEAAITLVPYPMKPGLPSAGRKPRLRYRLCRGRFTKCPDVDKLKVVGQGTVTAPRLSSIPKLPDDDYALELEGYMEIPETGVWSLAIGSDDGGRLFVDGELVADNDGPHPMQSAGGKRRLEKGLHPVRIEFFEATGDAELEVTLCRDNSSATQEAKYFFDGQE
jgi:S1-C subfamily serine protease